MASLPPRLDLAARNTPLQPLHRFCDAHDLPLIWVKRDDLTGSVTGGNKIRKLEFTLAKAKAEGADVLITCGGVQSNHCRATALLGAQLGFKVHLILRGDKPRTPQANLMLDTIAGATISYHPATDYHRGLSELFAETAASYEAQGLKTYMIPTGASDAVGCWGYVAACEELARDFKQAGIKPEHIVTATGSGGTQAGLTAGAVLHQLNAAVHGVNVCDDEAWFLNKVGEDLRDWQKQYDVDLDVSTLSINVIDGYVGPGYAKAEPVIFDMINSLARSEGLVLDPVYTGKAFYGMVQELKAGRFGDGDIVFVLTGGYLGLFAYESEVAANV